MPINTAPVFYNPLDGKVITDSNFSKFTVLDDGKILVAGKPDLIRYNSNGSLDDTFGVNGVIAHHSFGTEGARAIEVLANGKILLAGSINDQFAVARYNADGTLDNSFGLNGIATTSFSNGFNTVRDMKVQADGKILISGRATFGYSNDSAVVRLNVDGTVDTSFGNSGSIVEDFGAAWETATNILLMPDQSIVIATDSDLGSERLEMRHFDINGQLDTSFGFNGLLERTYFPFTDLTLLQNGNILAIGGYNYVNLFWFTSGGQVDRSQSELGYIGNHPVADPYASTNPYATYIQQDGKILIAGTIYNDFMVLRYNVDGTLDTNFGVNGVFRADFIKYYDTATELKELDDGSILVVGGVGTATSGEYKLGMLKLKPNGTLDTNFGLGVVNNNPVFTEGTPVILAPTMRVFDKDLAAGNYAGSTLELSRSGGPNSDDHFVTLAGHSILSLEEGQDLIVWDNVIGKVNGNSHGHLSIEFNSNATDLLVNYAVQDIAYLNFSQTLPEYITIDWTFRDGNTGLQGDGGEQSVTKSIKVITSTVNDPPFQQSEKANLIAGTEDTNYIVTKAQLLQGVSDPEDNPLSINQISANHGSVTLNNDGLSYTIIPSADYFGDILLSYSISDGNGATFQTNQQFTLTAVNDAPEAEALLPELAKGKINKVYVVSDEQLLSGIVDADGDSVQLSGLHIDKGNFVINPDATYTITQATNFTGLVNLTFDVTDGNGGIYHATRSLNIGPNVAPGLTGDKALLLSGVINKSYTITTSQLLQGYTDEENDSLSISGLSADHGSIINNHNGTYTIDPALNYNDSIKLSYNVIDGNGGVTAASNSFNLSGIRVSPLTIKTSFADTSNINQALSNIGTLANLDTKMLNAGEEAGYAILSIARGFYVYSYSSSFVNGETFDGYSFYATGSRFTSYPKVINSIKYYYDTGWISMNTNLRQNSESSSLTGNIYNSTLITGDMKIYQTFDYDVTKPSNFSITSAKIRIGDTSILLSGSFKRDTSVDFHLKGTIKSLALSSGHESITISGLNLSFKDMRDFSSISDLLASAMSSKDNVQGSNGAEKLYGYDGNDSLKALKGDDTLDGGNGDDLIDGGPGQDSMIGGGGNDTYLVDNLLDVIYEEVDQGIDQVKINILSSNGTYELSENVENATIVSKVAFSVIGNAQDNYLIGNKAANFLTGAAGDDTLDGAAGADSFSGGDGNDTYLLDQQSELLNITEAADQGTDTLILSYKNTSKLIAKLIDLDTQQNLNYIENVTVKGTGLFDLVGNASNNQLIGNASINHITGGDGNDTLSGAAGNDTLTGGAGHDMFVFDSKLAKNNVDTISDFSAGQDVLALDHLIFKKLLEGNLSMDSLVNGNTAPTNAALSAGDYLYFNTSNGDLYYDTDANGKGVAIKFATLTGVSELSASDILVI